MDGQSLTDYIDIAATASQPVDPNRALLRWDTQHYDFGTAVDGEVVAYDFRFTNVGKKPLHITGSDTECGCAIPVYDEKVVNPGQSEVVTVQFSTAGREGPADKKVSIFTDVLPSRHILRLTGTVIAADSTQAILTN